MTLRPARRSALTLTGLALGGALVLAAPLAASAHVHVHSDDAAAGATSRLEFSFSHGCDGAATSALVFDIPEGVDNVTPVVDGVWKVSRVLGQNNVPTQLTYTAVTPIEDGFAASASFDALFSSKVGDTDIAFPVTQKCVTGQTDWNQIAKDGEDPETLESPAPVVAVAPASAATASDHDDDGDHDEHAAAAPAAAETSTEPIATWLGGGALILGAAALVVAILNRRRA
ncbi:DUF1775 domain-containing protein [Microbacterium aquilitoris]|uniref:DUF1775 domain-containing protein n=1 Tax=Microbacterium aquilitoris TaxID=3067307 RepID=A0ABU3GJ14_9MICO|nr:MULTISPECIES: DUF1775 domain-containing protein [unclassified Microbacterium]MDT3330683.1 DUF1775 domain-containing protein [Microbacterium sp. KSW-18]MDT3344562.1 DUF1775 domain-containing protein [Microbacterium sp. KSW2-22]